MKKMKKKIIVAVLCAIMAFMPVSNSFILGNTCQKVNAAVNAKAYKNWKQYDGRWKYKTLGELCNMGNSGCKITAIAMLMAKSKVESINDSVFNPGVLRDRLESKGYISHNSGNIIYDGNLSPNAFAQANSPNFYRVGEINTNPTPFTTIRTQIINKLKAGYYCEVRVKYNKHSVAVDGYTYNDITICDPGSGYTSLKLYDGGISSVIYYKKSGSTPTSYTTIKSANDYSNGITYSNISYPGQLKTSSSFNVRGTVSSYSNITKVTTKLYLLNTYGNIVSTVDTAVRYPNARSYDLRNIDASVLFNRCNIYGRTYKYQIIVTNSSGYTGTFTKTFRTV